MPIYWKSTEGGCGKCGYSGSSTAKTKCSRCNQVGCHKCIGNNGSMCKDCKQSNARITYA